MKKIALLLSVSTFALVNTDANAGGNAACPQAVDAVLETLWCVENEDLGCALAGYDESFVKFHNGVDTETVISPEFWGGAFLLTDLAVDINHVAKIEKNLVSIRYVETVTLTPSVVGLPLPDQTFTQYEHALVSLNKQCQITVWDQYGDNQEQDAVTEAINAVLAMLGL